jgi:hypothetical protein
MLIFYQTRNAWFYMLDLTLLRHRIGLS